MSSSAEKWQSLRNEQRVEIGLVQVDIGARDRNDDPDMALVVKGAKDALKDALATLAEGHGGKLSAWERDSGTFLFLIVTPDGVNACCSAAIEMLEQLPAADLDRFLTIRISCDAGTGTYDADTSDFAGDFVARFKKYERAASAANRVTITDHIFRRLKPPLKARFLKWKHSAELGVDLYCAVDAPVRIPFPPADPPPEKTPPSEEETPRGKSGPAPGSEPSTPQEPFGPVSRKALASGAVALAFLLIGGLVGYLARPTAPPPQPPAPTPPWTELVQSPEWRSWRTQIHEKLTAGQVTEETLADALTRLPPHDENAPAALRRDQAVADVLMAYPEVRSLLKKRLGIADQDGYLGTGLSKPYTAPDYGAASIHEYLLPNLPDSDDDVWTWRLEPNQTSMTVKELMKSPQDDPKNKPTQRISEWVHGTHREMPAVIRFAILSPSVYKKTRTLGHPDRYRVFASNLAEVWNTSLQDAAARSGHTFTPGGESLYVWVFVPKYPTQVVPATWAEVLKNLPTWLREKNN